MSHQHKHTQDGIGILMVFIVGWSLIILTVLSFLHTGVLTSARETRENESKNYLELRSKVHEEATLLQQQNDIQFRALYRACREGR